MYFNITYTGHFLGETENDAHEFKKCTNFTNLKSQKDSINKDEDELAK